MRPRKIKKGDIVRAVSAGTPLEHIYIILEDQSGNNHVQYGCGVKILECIYSLDLKERFGNILKSYSKLCSEICRAFHNCTISEKFENVCDCEYEIIEKEINSGLTTESNCGCET